MHVQGPKPLDHTQTSLAFITVFFHTRSQFTLQYKNRPFTLGVQNTGKRVSHGAQNKTNERNEEAESILMFARIDRKARWRCVHDLKSGGYKCHWSGLDCMLRRWINSHIRIIDLIDRNLEGLWRRCVYDLKCGGCHQSRLDCVLQKPSWASIFEIRKKEEQFVMICHYDSIANNEEEEEEAEEIHTGMISNRWKQFFSWRDGKK
jgi:hypothetical protein